MIPSALLPTDSGDFDVRSLEKSADFYGLDETATSQCLDESRNVLVRCGQKETSRRLRVEAELALVLRARVNPLAAPALEISILVGSGGNESHRCRLLYAGKNRKGLRIEATAQSSFR